MEAPGRADHLTEALEKKKLSGILFYLQTGETLEIASHHLNQVLNGTQPVITSAKKVVFPPVSVRLFVYLSAGSTEWYMPNGGEMQHVKNKTQNPKTVLIIV